MSIRLTKTIRTDIVQQLLKYRFEETALKVIDMEAKLATRVFNVLFDDKTRKQIDDIPEGWLPTIDAVSVKYDDSYHSFCFDGGSVSVHNGVWGNNGLYLLSVYPSKGKRKKIRVPDSFSRRNNGAILILDDAEIGKEQCLKIKNEIDEYDTLQKDLHADVKRAYKDAWSILTSVTTTKALIEAWPEVEDFVPVEESKCKAIAIPVEKLNKTFKLPKEQKKAS